MDDYIKREDVLSLAKDICIPQENGFYRHRCIDPQVVRELPAADVWPVVLCRDCKHYNPSNRDWKCESVMGLVEPDEEDFCSYGERKGADHELLKL